MTELTFDEFRVRTSEDAHQLHADELLALYALVGRRQPDLDDLMTLCRACRIADLECGRTQPIDEKEAARAHAHIVGLTFVGLTFVGLTFIEDVERDPWPVASDRLHAWFDEALAQDERPGDADRFLEILYQGNPHWIWPQWPEKDA